MTSDRRLKEDMAYVRAATERSVTVPAPSIHLLWALLGLCGFTLVDFVEDYRWIGIYWLFAGPVGFGFSVWLGVRADRDAGRTNRETGLRHGLHWLAFMVAGVFGLALVRAGHLTWQGFGSLWVLLLAMTYFHVGLHLERRLLPVGLLMGVGYLITIWVPRFGWTTAGVLLAIALTAGVFWGAPKREASD